MKTKVRYGVVQPTPSQYFISRASGSQEMSWAAAGDFANDGSVGNERFYIHDRVYPPHVDLSEYRLHVSGDAVRHPLTLTFDEIRKLPSHTIDCVLDCGANARAFFPKQPPGETWPLPVGFTEWQWGAMGAAKWKGVLLADILERAGADGNGIWTDLTGLDLIPQGVDQTLPYSHIGKTHDFLEAGTLLACEMNGEPLPPDHGFPLRAVVPGYGGNVMVKWLHSVSVTRTEPPPSPLQQNQLLVGPDYHKGGVTPPKQNPKSAFELAWNGTIKLKAAEDVVTIHGRAWSASATVKKIEIMIEEEQPDGSWKTVVAWHEVKPLTTPIKHWWVRFEYKWKVKPGVYRLRSRTTDDTGAMQPPPEHVRWNQHGLHWNGTVAHPVTVLPMTNMP